MSEVENTSVFIYNGEDEVPIDVTNIRVNSSVTVIRARAFQHLHNLEEVELPEGLIRIENNAFEECESLKRINIPSTVVEIDYRAFENCKQLEEVELPDGLIRIGFNAFNCCESLKRIIIPSMVTDIGRSSFLYCSSLSEVALSEGLEVIGKDAFSRCKALVSVTLSSSLKVVGIESFEGCERLNEIHIPDTIESIRSRAFKNCNFTNFRMPPSIGNVVDINIVEGNKSLVSLELSENVTQITVDGDYASQPRLESLRNVALPSECEVDNCTDLRVAFPNEDVDTIPQALQQRFDDLPIHKICYYQSYQDNETTMQHLKREINPWSTKFPGQLNVSGKEQDCLGMTPLHILACSTKPTIEMYRLLIDKYPETLIMKDKWGDVPLLYALWCNVPTEVLDLLLESYKTLHPEFIFDWRGMILTLAKRNVPLPNIKTLINTQRSSLPDQEYDIRQVVMELATCDKPGFRSLLPSTVDETFRYLLRVRIIERLDSLAVGRWLTDMENMISTIHKNVKFRVGDTKAVYDRLATYEIAKEGTSVLELALWKTKIDEVRNKRARVSGDISYREQSRINCGADIIIRNVLPYLIPYYRYQGK